MSDLGSLALAHLRGYALRRRKRSGQWRPLPMWKVRRYVEAQTDLILYGDPNATAQPFDGLIPRVAWRELNPVDSR